MQLKLLLSFFALSLLAAQAPTVESYKILAIYPFPGKSHFMMHNALVKALVDKGHEVTMVTAYTLASEKLGSNYTEILINPVYDFWGDVKTLFGANNLFELTSLEVPDFLKMLEVIGIKTTEHALKQPKVQALIHANQTVGVFDLLLIEQFYDEAFLPLALKYNMPVVASNTLGIENHMSQQFGAITPWSFVPHGFMPFTDRMSFYERLRNSFFSLYEDWHREFSYFPKMDELTAQYFSHLPMPLPKVTQMEKNISVILLNSHVALTTARPKADGMIYVGGMQIYEPKALPADIQKFLDEAKDGAIYFSLGSNVQSKDMPAEKLKVFLDVFASIKQRVLWKYEDESIPNLPANVMIKKWMPQSDILSHRNVKVFITHGGLFGTQEAVHYGVPLLGMPFYCDQHLNMNKAVLGGYAINLNFPSITPEILKNGLNEIMQNPSYKHNIERISRVFRDRPMSARDTAVYWIEYVIRHNGAPHLRSAGLDLKWYQFYLLDVIAFIAGGVLLVVILLVILLRLLCGGKSSQKKQKRQ